MAKWAYGAHNPGNAGRVLGRRSPSWGFPVNLRATSSFRAGDFARLEQLLVPRLLDGIRAATMATLGAAEAIVPVDTGQLQESGSTGVEWQGRAVVGFVQFTAPWAAFVEFGTGARGAASPGAGPYEYTMSWPGMRAQPYLRPALDSSRGDVLDAIRSALA